MILIDVFVHKGEIVKWYRGDTDVFIRDSFRPTIYFRTFNEGFARKILSRQEVKKTRMKHMVDGTIPVLKIRFNSILDFRYNFFHIENKLKNVGIFYNADISIPEMYMFKHDLFPLKNDNDNINNYDYQIPEFRIAKIKLGNTIEFNKNILSINEFVKEYNKLDPDIIFISGQQRELINLTKYGIKLNRYGDDYFPKIKGNSYFSYGQSFYRETPIYLKGRLLLNSGSFMIDDFNIFSILEGSRICRMTIQRCASHSVGASITNLLTYQAYKDGYLIPYKVGVYEKIKPFSQLVACDRGAYTLEPIVGLHRDVVELDFISMYPSIISRYNLSPEKLNCKCCKEKIVGTNYNFCTKDKGIVPKVCDYLIDRRLHFKKRKDYISKSKVGYLKWLLVVIFGFQSFRAKKIGCIEVHESINAAARNSLFKAIRLCEKRGYNVIHGIVDSLYLTKKNMDDLDQLIKEINQNIGLPIEKKQLYRFMTFLPSVNSDYMPVPTAYYGVGMNGEIKVRGIEIRQRGVPNIVKSMQKEIIDNMYKDIDKSFIKSSLKILRNHIEALDNATVDDLSMKVRVGKDSYAVNCPQKILKDYLERKGVKLMAGQSVKYVIEDFEKKSYIIADDFRGIYDRKKYIELMKKAFIHLFLPFNIKEIDLDGTKQKTLLEYEDKIRLSAYTAQV